MCVTWTSLSLCFDYSVVITLNEDSSFINWYIGKFVTVSLSSQDFVGATDPNSSRILMTKQADWAKSSKEPRAAAEMYLSAGEHLKAIDIIGEHGWADMYVSVIL